MTDTDPGFLPCEYFANNAQALVAVGAGPDSSLSASAVIDDFVTSYSFWYLTGVIDVLMFCVLHLTGEAAQHPERRILDRSVVLKDRLHIPRPLCSICLRD